MKNWTLIIVSFFICSMFIIFQDERKSYLYVYYDKVTIPEVADQPKTLPHGLSRAVMTSYGPDCDGCSGITASGFDVRNTIYYNDKDYGYLSIVAADRSIPFGTVIEFYQDSSSFKAIVLDRGGAIGFDSRSQFDLLRESEYISLDFGVVSVSYKILRVGY